MEDGLSCSRCPQLEQDRNNLYLEFYIFRIVQDYNRNGLSSLTTDVELLV
jgi:hypothetical protein